MSCESVRRGSHVHPLPRRYLADGDEEPASRGQQGRRRVPAKLDNSRRAYLCSDDSAGGTHRRDRNRGGALVQRRPDDDWSGAEAKCAVTRAAGQSDPALGPAERSSSVGHAGELGRAPDQRDRVVAGTSHESRANDFRRSAQDECPARGGVRDERDSRRELIPISSLKCR